MYLSATHYECNVQNMAYIYTVYFDSSNRTMSYLHQVPHSLGVKWQDSTNGSCCMVYLHIHPLCYTAVPPPQLTGFIRLDPVARFVLRPDTAARSERYISSLERTDLGVPLEVEFEETQSSGALGDTIDRNVSAPGAVYNIKIWSINGASFSYDPLVAATTLLFDTGTEATNMDIVYCTSH